MRQNLSDAANVMIQPCGIVLAGPHPYYVMLDRSLAKVCAILHTSTCSFGGSVSSTLRRIAFGVSLPAHQTLGFLYRLRACPNSQCPIPARKQGTARSNRPLMSTK